MSNRLAVDAKALAKRYENNGDDPIEAVRGLDLAIAQGEIYAMLGPNGAGKTTTLSMLTTLLTPTSGTAFVAGYDVAREPANVRRNIGVTFQEIVLDDELTGRQVLDFHGQLYGLKRQERSARIDELMQLVELNEAVNRKVGSYSGGMKRRLELARGLMTWPQVLFLDEPTQGLDPHNRAGIWQYIRRLRDEMGITLLLTTHYMEEATALADRVGIIDHGKLVIEGTPHALVRQMGADVVSIVGHGAVHAFADAAQACSFVTNIAIHEQPALEPISETGDSIAQPVTAAPAAGSVVQLGVDAGERRLVELIQIAAEQGFRVQEVSVAKPTLADVFLAHTGHALRD